MPVPTGLITVAVCSVGEPGEALDACLAALEAAGVTQPQLLTASGGISTLRNKALAECQTPVIAFVDDDIVVSPSWLGVLAEAWGRASPTVACIGGPIDVDVHPDSPEWMTTSLARVVSANTPRVENALANAKTHTFCGGNVSFSADALRGIGGFWPAAGAGRLRDWYSEEHHAQREMARVGWEAIMDPDLSVRRTVAPAVRVTQLAADQARAGARRRLIGGGDSGEAGAALRAAAGALQATAMGNRQLATERLIRAAGHAGTLAPGLIGAGTIAPSADATPFRHSIPAGAGSPRGRSSTPRVYCYHRVTEGEVPSGLSETPAAFRSQLEELCRLGGPEPIESIARGRAARGSFAITFDDGYADNLHVVLPILEELEIPATFFVTSGHVLEARPFWWDQIARILSETAKYAQSERSVLSLSCEGQTRSWAPKSAAEIAETHGHLVNWLQDKAPEEIVRVVDDLAQWSGTTPEGGVDRPLTPIELQRLADHPLVTIGAHTRTHINLRSCGEARLKDELVGSREDLETLIGSEVNSMAYPFGVWGADVDSLVADAAAAAGFELGVLNSAAPRKPSLLTIGRRTFPAG